MWSTPSDRDRAEAAVQKKPLTAPQQRARAEREALFNAGYDAAVTHFLSHKLYECLDFTGHGYTTRRKELFDRHDLDLRVQAYQAEQRKRA